MQKNGECQIDITLRRAGLASGPGPLRRYTRAILQGAASATGWSGAAISVLYCDRAQIRALNAEFRGIVEETDVLSFPAAEDVAELVGEMEPHLGDLAICLPYTHHSADEQSRNLDEEVALLLVHGFLHLLGFDHDTAAKKKTMWKETDRILALLRDVPRPGLEMKPENV